MKLKHHIFRIISSIALSGLFIFVLVRTESWLWICVECIGFINIAVVIIAIDKANEINDEDMIL